jgi:hypothetical protein
MTLELCFLFVILQGNPCGVRKKTKFMDKNKKKRKKFRGPARRDREPWDGGHDYLMPFPKPMIGFSSPNDRLRSVDLRFTSQAIGPLFFYYENVALAPKSVWTRISRFLYEIKPEFVDSRFFCACARKRGYIHNLPIQNRSPLIPIPPKTNF